MIGGTDIELTIPSDVPAADVIFRTVRRHWPNFVFKTPMMRRHRTPQPRMACYRSLLAPNSLFTATSKRQRTGTSMVQTPANFNTMLHVILGEQEPAGSGMRPLTLVCDDLWGKCAS